VKILLATKKSTKQKQNIVVIILLLSFLSFTFHLVSQQIVRFRVESMRRQAPARQAIVIGGDERGATGDVQITKSTSADERNNAHIHSRSPLGGFVCVNVVTAFPGSRRCYPQSSF
jgi:hypothetical protein